MLVEATNSYGLLLHEMCPFEQYGAILSEISPQLDYKQASTVHPYFWNN